MAESEGCPRKESRGWRSRVVQVRADYVQMSVCLHLCLRRQTFCVCGVPWRYALVRVCLRAMCQGSGLRLSVLAGLFRKGMLFASVD